MCQNPDVASLTVKYLDCSSSGRMSSRVLANHWFLSFALFKSFGSRHSLRLLSSFITGTMELIHSVCSCTYVMMPSFTSLSNSALQADCIPNGTDLGGCWTGLYESFNFMWYGSPGRVPTPLKTSAYSCSMYSLVVGKGWVLPFIVTAFSYQETCGDLGSCAVVDFTLVAALCSSWAVCSVLGVVLRLSVDCAVFQDCRLLSIVSRLYT